ncbi:hypothetical protein C0992_001456 [Termitomyces sp. T32_za158]|nr:hypothetical protein C0992_001456 [Termitomyces sp. T32_za158]
MLSPPRLRAPAPPTPGRRPPPSQLLVPTTERAEPGRLLGLPLRFELVRASVSVRGYQLYAVEKWLLERSRAPAVLLVYTGDPAHKARRPRCPARYLTPRQVSVSSIRPHADLDPPHAQAEWDKALAHLSRDGARPKEVCRRQSSLCLSHASPPPRHPTASSSPRRSRTFAQTTPSCSSPAATSGPSTTSSTQTSISSEWAARAAVRSLSRIQGKSPAKVSLHLISPSDATKSRFISTYCMPQSIAAESRSHSHSSSFVRYTSENSATSSSSVSKPKPALALALPKAKPNPDFIDTVLELVKLIQAALALFGMYRLVPKSQTICPHRDGLLCDETVDAIRRWILDIGQPCVGLEPMERIADPMFVAALISLVLSVRHKLAAIGDSNLVPRDPFFQPQSFICALTNFSQTTNPTTVSQDPLSIHVTHPTPPQLTPSTSGSSGSPPPPTQTVLTRELVDAINLAYDCKVGPADSRVGGRRVRRAIRDKLRAGIDSDPDAGSPGAERGATSGGEGGGSGIGIVGGDHRDGKDREREKETLGGVGTGVGSSGGQILSGIGSFASGLGLPVGPGASSAAGGGAVIVTTDLGLLVRSIYLKDWKGKGKRAIRKRGDEADLLGVNLGYSGKEKEKDGGVGLSVRALWSGQVDSIVKLRQWEAEQEKEKVCGPPLRKRDRWALSDGDVDDSVGVLAKSETEEESDAVTQQASFRGMWGGKVQKKLGSWTGLHKRRANASLDLRSDNGSTQADSARLEMSREKSLTLSPLLPPIVFSGADGEPDDDDLLSSGQTSPIDNVRPSPFSLIQDARSLENTSLPTSEYERKVTEFNQKRPWGNRKPHSRISTWADPLSARELLDKERYDLKRCMRSRHRRRARAGRGTSTSASDTWEDSDGYASSQEDEGSSKRTDSLGQQRRRSFHDIDTLRGLRVMHIEHMRVDVELAGQFLIMSRREQHLQNVIACLQVLTSTLSTTNSQLREDYTTHAPFISELDTHTQVISNIDIENAKADKTSQATNILRYEAEQFRVADLWHAAMPSRQKVFALREKVFGTGGRRLPPGVHGAHGKFNRLQWTLDGKERLVDHLGRTESEAEEEEPGVPYLGLHEEDEDEDVVQHPGIKPMWLLRFFTSWGARWGVFAATSSQPDEASKQGTPQSIPDISGTKTEDLGLSRTGSKSPPLNLPDTEDESISPVSVSS